MVPVTLNLPVAFVCFNINYDKPRLYSVNKKAKETCLSLADSAGSQNVANINFKLG